MLKALKSATRFFSPKESKQQSSSLEAKNAFGYYGNIFNENIFTFATEALKWMQYYITVAPVGDAIDKIANKACKIPLILFAPDKTEAEMPITSHPFLKLLKNPNPYQTQEQFVNEAIVHERATGNNYMRVMGLIDGDRLSREPVEIYNLRPDLITISNDVANNSPSYYRWTQPTGTIITFYRRLVRDVNGDIITAYIEPNGFSQLYHFKNISSNINYNYRQFYGDAPLQSCELQIGQFFEAAVYNYFLIKNGLSAKTLASPATKDPLDVNQLEKLKTYMTQKFTGSINSGKMIVSTLPLKIDNIGVAVKDMDFKSLDERTSNAVYRKMEIPLPLVDADNTSLANMATSYLMLYDNAILPALDTFCSNLFTFILRQRYKDGRDFVKFGYNESSIGALQPRIAENLKLFKESGDTTVNERRELLGLSRVDSELCDQIFISNNLVPIGKDTNLTDTIGIEQQDDRKKQMEILLRKQKKPDGTPFYSEKELREAI